MPNLNLSDSELAILRDVLENAEAEMGTEISGTDAKDYRDDLKERREVLQKVSQFETLAEHQTKDAARRCAKRQAHTNLIGSLRCRIRDDAIGANSRKQERHSAEADEEPHQGT